MKGLIRAILCAATLCLAAHASAQTTKVGKASFDNSIELGNKTLNLNGAGIRYKAVFRVYAAGLYLQKKTNSVEEVLADTGPRRIRVSMFQDIDANKLGKLFTEGMEKNTERDEFIKALPGTIKMAELFAAKRELKTGDTFNVDYIPGVGTTITVNSDAPSPPIKEPEFFTVLLKIWLGKSPADNSLKSALLGQTRRVSQD
jgi:hypothetical protein